MAMYKKTDRFYFKDWKLGKKTHFLVNISAFCARQNGIQMLHSVQTSVLFAIIGMWHLKQFPAQYLWLKGDNIIQPW